MEMASIDIKQIETKLKESKEHLAANLRNSVAMFAVLPKDSVDGFELKCIPFDRNEDTFEFDSNLFSIGLSPFLEEDVLAPINEAIDDKNKIACVTMDWFSENDDDTEEGTVASLCHEIERLLVPQSGCRDLETGDIENVKGIVFRYAAGEDVIFAYQRTQNTWIAKRSKLIVWEDKSFKLYTKESLRIGNQFDFLVFDKWMLIRRVKTLETQFQFNKILESQAASAVGKLGNLISDPNGYIEEKVSTGDSATIRRLIKLKDLPVLRMNSNDVYERAKLIPEYRDLVNFDDDRKISIKYKKDIKGALKLLNDEFLESPLTGGRYESPNKKLLSKSRIK